MPDIPVSRFFYELPESAIAQEPIPQRDHARFLCYRAGELTHHHFYDLPNLLLEPSLLVFNDTKVIPARLWFQNSHGARIEIFLLKELSRHEPQGTYIWECLAGNRKKFKEGDVLRLTSDCMQLEASWFNRDANQVMFRCKGTDQFLSIIEHFGHVPLPPYIRRADVPSDQERYQSVFARNAGAVAAPTASLHFTDKVLQELNERGHQQAYLTLHVGAGTFKPVIAQGTAGHEMHTESFSIAKATLLALKQQRPLIAVGTTVMRVLESLYFAAIQVRTGNLPVRVAQDDPYRNDLPDWSADDVVNILLEYLEHTKSDFLTGETSIFIVPGMKFRMCAGLITNFHQPGSTLLMLVEAFMGSEWVTMYQEALSKGYRMLSYGDSSIIIPNVTT
ncbi:MAG: S-adenosylmethionine:tRNA ribosyltransferase-isomerase [Bacteroidota bacterium]